MATVVDKIKDKIDIVDLIGGYIRLQKSGMNFKARCPFHNEKTPSFFVSPERQIWHCFGCSSGGDIFGFIKQIEGVEFPEALKLLAAKAGVKLDSFDKEFQSHKSRLYDITELSAKFFEKQLFESNAGKKVLNYLTEERGLTVDSIKKWRLGFAPNSWRALKVFLKNVGYTEKEISDAGLTVNPTKSDSYDRFRNRIIFPISNIQSQVVGFAGRIFEEPLEQPGDSKESDVRVPTPSGVGTLTPDVERQSVGAKYINTPQTPIYDKSRAIYGLDKSRLNIRNKRKCLVVEGNMDVIMSHQAGAGNVVASSGTALTNQQVRIIKRYSDNLDICFDADIAGDSATKRGIDLALSNGLNVGVILLKEEKDPADYVKKFGEKWVERAEQSKSVVEFYIDSAIERHDPKTALGKKEISNLVLPVVAAIQNKVEQSHWLSILSQKLNVKEEVLVAAMNDSKKDEHFQEEEKEIVSVKSSREILEEALLSLIIFRPELKQMIDDEFLNTFQIKLHREILTQLLALKDSEMPRPKTEDSDEISLKENILYLKSQELWKELNDKEVGEEFDKLLRNIRKDNVKKELILIQDKVRLAGSSKDDLNELLERLQKLSDELKILDANDYKNKNQVFSVRNAKLPS